jgi:hypothetical protein
MTRKQLTPIVALVALATVLTACGGGSSAAKAPKRPKQTTTTSTTQPPVPTFPETGLPDPQKSAAGRPALWVKIENTRPARPQSGLAEADVVYSEITEGGITRFIALYNSRIPDVVGPIRSVRVMDPQIVKPLGGIFVYSGGIPETVALINASGLNVVDESKAGPAMFRDNSREAPHNLYGHGPGLLALGGQPTPPPPLFEYLGAGKTFSGDPAPGLSIGYGDDYNVGYTWDAPSGSWKRTTSGEPFVDTAGHQIAPTNVIVQYVGCCLDGFEGARYQTVGSGPAWVFSNGAVLKGVWQRSDPTQVTKFTTIFGAPIQLTPGPTWVEFVPGFGPPVSIP